jgi:hypothetical protein
LARLLVLITNIHSLGLYTAQGLRSNASQPERRPPYTGCKKRRKLGFALSSREAMTVQQRAFTVIETT